MHPDDYCEAKLAPGSARRYALMTLPARDRSALLALWALELEVREVIDECREPALARAKLEWWREELGRLGAGAPQHPATRALAPHLARHHLSVDALRELVDGAGMDLEYDAYPSFSQLVPYCHRIGSTPALLAAELLGYQDRATARFAHELGQGLALLELLREARADALKGRYRIPEDEMRSHGVGHADLARPRSSAQTAALFDAQAARIRASFARALEWLPVAERAGQRPLLVRLRLAQALLDEIEADGFRVLEHRIELTPLRQLWLAWNTHRHARRGRLG